MAKEKSFFGKLEDFFMNILISLGSFFAFIFSPITNLWKKKEQKKEEIITEKSVDKPKQIRKEARKYEFDNYFKQKNATQQRRNRTKKTNIFGNQQQENYGNPIHFDKLTKKQQPNSDFEGSIHFLNRDKDIDDQDDSNSTNFNDNNNDYNHSSNVRSRFQSNQQQNYVSNNNNRQDHQPRKSSQTNNQSSNHHKPLSKEDKKRQEIGQETMQVVMTGNYKYFNKRTNKSELCDIKEKVEYCYNHTKTIKPNQELPIDDSIAQNSGMCKIEVTIETSFEALRRIKTGKNRIRETCILNFASATQPGGGFLNGRNAQEETLSRQSALYFSLTQESEMYDYNKMENNSYYSDFMIYSPNVPFFRDDNYKFIEPFTASVITSPAVNYAELMKNENNSRDVENKIYHVMKNRCERIIRLCINKGNKALILGAFGCGVFKNPPEMVSQIFKELLIDNEYGRFLKCVVFPIASEKGTKSYTYNVFRKAFDQ